MFFFDHLATLTRTDNEQESTAQLAKSPQFGAAKVYERNSHNTRRQVLRKLAHSAMA